MRSTFRKMDKVLLIFMIAFTIFGLYMIFSASSITAVLYNGLPEYYYAQKQLIFIIAAWIFGFIVLKIPTKRYYFLGSMGMVAILIALGAIFSYGSITNSARRWFDLGFFSFQPSEFAKSITIVYLACRMERLIKRKDTSINSIITQFIPVLGIAILTLFQPDLGTAFVIGCIALLIFLVLPINTKEFKVLRYLAIAGVIVAAIFVRYSSNFLRADQLSRFNYQAPCTRYTEKTGYQVCNGLIAISNGGLKGAGLGNSTQKYLYLPEAHTDFIFPIVVEELGALIAVVVIFCYLGLLYVILKIAKSAANLRGSIMAFGAFAYILLHLLVNFMGVLALIPLTGISVPFLSYGGSFYINIIFVLFLVQRVQIESFDARKESVLGE